MYGPPCDSTANANLGATLMWQGNIAEGMKYLHEAHRIDPQSPGPAETGIAIGIQFYIRQRFNAAVASSNCQAADSYAKELLTAAPDDEISETLQVCVPKRIAHDVALAKWGRLPTMSSDRGYAIRRWPNRCGLEGRSPQEL